VKPSTISLAGQEWMATNLDVTTFRNGLPIMLATESEAWAYAAHNNLPACCDYEDNAVLGSLFGKLYNFHAVNSPYGLAPQGFKIPSRKAWEHLAQALGGFQRAGATLKSTDFWEFSSPMVSEPSHHFFQAVPAGLRYENGFCDLANFHAFFWIAEALHAKDAYGINLYADDSLLLMRHYAKGNGFSVRCIKD